MYQKVAHLKLIIVLMCLILVECVMLHVVVASGHIVDNIAVSESCDFFCKIMSCRIMISVCGIFIIIHKLLWHN